MTTPQALNRLRQQDRTDLERLLAHLNGAFNAVRRDECGDPIIRGSRGTIHACDGAFRAFVTARSAKHWTYTKRALATFCTVLQDGDDEGVLRIDRMPSEEESATIRDVIGLRQTRPAPVRGFARQKGDENENLGPELVEGD